MQHRCERHTHTHTRCPNSRPARFCAACHCRWPACHKRASRNNGERRGRLASLQPRCHSGQMPCWPPIRLHFPESDQCELALLAQKCHFALLAPTHTGQRMPSQRRRCPKPRTHTFTTCKAAAHGKLMSPLLLALLQASNILATAALMLTPPPTRMCNRAYQGEPCGDGLGQSEQDLAQLCGQGARRLLGQRVRLGAPTDKRLRAEVRHASAACSRPRFHIEALSWCKMEPQQTSVDPSAGGDNSNANRADPGTIGADAGANGASNLAMCEGSTRLLSLDVPPERHHDGQLRLFAERRPSQRARPP